MEFSKKCCVIALDIGGTFIKYGLVLNDNSIVFDGQVPADSHDNKEQLLNRFVTAIKACKQVAEANGLFVDGIAVSTPGPFDYKAGTSHMVGKYDEIYDIDLRKEFRVRAGLPDTFPIEFMQDAAAFLFGEYVIGAAKGYDNCMCVTLGTGTGYACIKDGKLLLNERKGPYYVLARQEYKNTGKLIEEIVSGTAILRNYGEDAKNLAKKALGGDYKAIKIFYELGKILGEALSKVKEIEDTQCLVIGGQISKDFALLENGITEGLGKYADKIKTTKAVYPANAALIGASTMLRKQTKL